MKGRATGSPEEIKSLQFINKEFQFLTRKQLSKQVFVAQLNDSIQLTGVNGYYFINNGAKKPLF